jgi:hypothetical protein
VEGTLDEVIDKLNARRLAKLMLVPVQGEPVPIAVNPDRVPYVRD